VGTYRFTLKSEEQEGAGQSNNIYIDLASDADAVIFAENVESLFMAEVVTIDKVVASDYTTTYPAGTDTDWRLVFRGANRVPQTERLYNILSSATPEAFAAAWQAVPNIGLVPPSYVDPYSVLVPITSTQVTVFNLTNGF